MCVSHLLDIKIMYFKGCMCHIRLLIWFGGFNKESVVIGIFESSIDVKKTCRRFSIPVEDI